MTQEDDEYLKKNIGIVQKIKGNVKAMNQYRKLYNTFCGECQIKVVKNPRMKLDEYCPLCQNRVKWRMEKIKEILK